MNSIKRAGLAVVAGTIASFTMNMTQAGIAAIFERGRADDDRDEEVEATSALVEELARVLSRDRTYPVVDGRIVHYFFGAAFAVAYAAVRERTRVIAACRGAAFGTALWIVSDLMLVRVMGLVRNDRHYSVAEGANALASHLTYGIVLEGIARLADR